MSQILHVRTGCSTLLLAWSLLGTVSLLRAETPSPLVYHPQSRLEAAALPSPGAPGHFKTVPAVRTATPNLVPLGPAMGDRAVQERVSVLPLSPALVAALKSQSAQETNNRFQIGLGRALDQPIVVNRSTVSGLQWQQRHNGWRTWSVQVGSPGALGLRLHLEGLTLPAGARLVIYDPNQPMTNVVSVTAQTAAGEPEVWSATSFSDQLVVECQVPPGVDPRNVAFTLSGFSHIYTLPHIGGNEKAAGTCNNDVTCYPADAQVASGIARIAFVDAGNLYLCTGCLLAGANNSADLFLTANHCVGSQSVASTLELFWFYQTSTCNGPAPSLAGIPMTGGGADLLATSPFSDYALLQLRQSPPPGTFSLGWSLAPPSSSETLTCIHHPSGSFKRISFGHLLASDAAFWAVQWSSGVTEPGSSGSPLLNANLQVIGQLNGGYGGPGSSCLNPSAPDQYGRFDVSYNGMQSWLGGGGGPVVNPVKGTYRGLFSDADNGVSPQSAGALALTTTAKGKFSGNLVLGAGRYAFRGQFDSSGSAQFTIRRLLAPLTVQLQVDPADADHLTGNVSDGTFNSSLSADRAVYDGRLNPAPQAGRYTLILPGNYSSADQPGGDSFGVLTVSKAGLIQFSAALADGLSASQATMVSKNGQWPLYLPLYGGKGLLFGWVDFASGGASDLSGTVTWMRPSMPLAKVYAAGFTSLTTAAGSLYTPPPAGGSILNLPSGQVMLSGANLDQNIVNQIALGNNNRVTNMSENRLNLLFALPTGTFRGGVINPQTTKALAFKGVVLQKQNIASGFFMNIDQSGEVMIAAP